MEIQSRKNTISDKIVKEMNTCPLKKDKMEIIIAKRPSQKKSCDSNGIKFKWKYVYIIKITTATRTSPR